MRFGWVLGLFAMHGLVLAACKGILEIDEPVLSEVVGKDAQGNISVVTEGGPTDTSEAAADAELSNEGGSTDGSEATADPAFLNEGGSQSSPDARTVAESGPCVGADCSEEGGACDPGATQCTSDTQVESCGANREWGMSTMCPYACVGTGVGSNCGGSCVPGTTSCVNDTQIETCNAIAQWGVATTCTTAPGTCSQGACTIDCNPPGPPGPLICGSPNGTTPAFYSCTQQSDCIPNTVCVDNGGDHAYYCKPVCTTSLGDCEQYVSSTPVSCLPGPGDGGPCTIALCGNGASSGVGVCDSARGSTLPPGDNGTSCCP
jgi:hypothetical protein